ncbi:cupin domain-containing protein [Streptomyces pinistramenti]|uniref:cupin domain-containing protein n=1 Tax=Streptomyces pinistramenti TaxID=2884812 RepID=UPI001D073CC6|nr:cupin domain-containing protein [Streptomyces pinistramenti]MCB5906661.1 cupin domain-containing protein [Streptomyces pinistramenti]
MGVATMRLTREAGPHDADELGAHPGTDWRTVLSGTVVPLLGERRLLVETGRAAQFSTMAPHALRAHGGPAEVLVVLDQDGERTPLRPSSWPLPGRGGGEAGARALSAAPLPRPPGVADP